MAYQSRAAVCRANTTYLGLYVSSMYIGIGGVDVTTSAIKESFSISMSKGPMEFECAFRNLSVTPGQEVQVRDGGAAGRVMFVGRVLTVKTQFRTSADDGAMYDTVYANNYWLLDRYAAYTNLLVDVSPAAAIRDVLSQSTDGGWSVGDVSDTLPDVGFHHVLRRVIDIFQEIAECVQATLVVNEADRTVSLITSYTDGHPITIDNNNTDVWDLKFEFDRAQSRNRIYAIGGKTTITTSVTPDSTEIGIENSDPFGDTTGRAILNGRVLRYTSTDATSTNTLSSLLEMDEVMGDPGDEIVSIKWVNDSADQSDLATTLGGGLSGQIFHTIRADTLFSEGIRQIRDADVATYSQELVSLSFMTRSRFVHPKKTVTVSLTSPRSVSATLVIDTVEIRARGAFDASTTNFEYEVTCSPATMTFPHVMNKLIKQELPT